MRLFKPTPTLPVTFVLCLGLSGCMSWPSEGYGGANEHQQSIAFYEPAASRSETQANLVQQLEVLQSQLDVLILQGANQCIPAAIKRLSLLSDRVRRELAGALLADAAHDLVVFQQELRYFRQRFMVIAQQTECQQVVAATSLPSQRRLMTIFFDHDDAQLSDAFAQQMAWLLADISRDAKVTLRGYTNQLGDTEHNDELARQRINAVAHALQRLGVLPGNLKTDVIGERHLLLQGHDSFAMGINRRVDLYIEDQATSKEPLPVSQWESLNLKATRSWIKAW